MVNRGKGMNGFFGDLDNVATK